MAIEGDIEQKHDITLEGPFPAAMLDLFMEDDDEEERESGANTVPAVAANDNIENNGAPAAGDDGQPNADEPIRTTVDGAIKTMVTDRFTILQANSLNYHSYLQGRSLERLSSTVVELLNDVYKNGGDMNAPTAFKQYLGRFFKTDEDRKDALFLEDQITNLIERIIQYKIHPVRENISEDDDDAEVIIPFVVIPHRIRIVRRRRHANVDELARLQRARFKQLALIRKHRPDAEIPTDYAELDLKPDRREELKTKRLKKEAKRFLTDTKPVADLGLDWGEEDEGEKDAPQELIEIHDDSVVEVGVEESATTLTAKRARFSTKVEADHDAIASNNADISFEESTREIVSNIGQFAAAVSENRSAFDREPHRHTTTTVASTSQPIQAPKALSRRQEIRQELGAYIETLPAQNPQHPAGRGIVSQPANTSERRPRVVPQANRKRQPPPSVRRKGPLIPDRDHVVYDGQRGRDVSFSPNRSYQTPTAQTFRRSAPSYDDYSDSESEEEYEMSDNNGPQYIYQQHQHFYFQQTVVVNGVTQPYNSDYRVNEQRQYSSDEYEDDDDYYFGNAVNKYDVDEDRNIRAATPFLSEGGYDEPDISFSEGPDAGPRGCVIVAPPTSKLKSCLKLFIRSDESKRRIHFSSDPHRVEYYEVDSDEPVKFDKVIPELLTRVPKMTIFTKPRGDAANQGRRANLIILPNSDNPLPLSKRTNPKLMSRTQLRESYDGIIAEVGRMLNIAAQRATMSRWVIADSLLSELNEDVLLNGAITRLDFPKLPDWLISKGLESFKNDFPHTITKVFVSYGYDIELLHSDDNSLIAMEFLRDLYLWFYHSISRRMYKLAKNIKDGSTLISETYRPMPVLVAINIPEIGDYQRQFQNFNVRLKNFIDGLNEREEMKAHGRIELLDWAGLIASCDDQNAMKTNEGRIRLLMQEMKLDYGLLCR